VRKHDQSGRPEKGNPVMKNLNRVRDNSAKKGAVPQGTNSTDKVSANNPAQPELLNPRLVIPDLTASLADLDSAVSAALTAALLNSESMRVSVKDNQQRWEEFEVFFFARGIVELPLLIGRKYDLVYSYFRAEISKAAAALKSLEPVRPLPFGQEKLNASIEAFKRDGFIEVETVIRSLQHCLLLQGETMCNRGDDPAISFAYELKDTIGTLWGYVRHHYSDFQNVYLAANSQRSAVGKGRAI
jgi:hypothetical protein